MLARTALGPIRRLGHLACFAFRSGLLALGQVQHEGNAVLLRTFEERGADQHGNALPVLAQVFLLVGCARSGLLEFGERSRISRRVVRRRQVGPSDRFGEQVSPAVVDQMWAPVLT